MRSYSALLVFENVFDSVDLTDHVLADLCDHVFYPRVKIVEDYCHTLLGEEVDVNYEVEGYIELATGEVITKSRIEELLSIGVYKVRIRTLSTCTSEGGVCAKCYQSSRQDEPYPEVGSMKTIAPLFVKSTEILFVDSQNSLTLTLSEDSFDKALIYCNETLYTQEDYTVSGNRLTFTSATIAEGSYAVVRYISDTKVPFMLWLAGTYSGSLLGINTLPRPLLPIRSLLLSSQIPEYSTSRLLDVLKDDSSRAPGNLVEYAESTPDLLERSLFSIALRTIYDAS